MKKLPVWVAGALFAWVGGALMPGSELAAAEAGRPRPDHVVVVIEENRSFGRIIGNSDAPYINALAARGALMEDSHGVTHPSQPNYLALFSGGTHRVRDDGCPQRLAGENLARLLIGRGLSFAIYSESMPSVGFLGCKYGAYRRKHNPVANWQGVNLPPSINRRFIAFARDFARLPTVAFVVPNQDNDMHDGSIARGDAWLARHIEPYLRWANDNNSLLILTWDESDYGSPFSNHIVTLLVGPMVKPGRYPQRIDHYSVLRTLSDLYGLAAPGEAATAKPITGIWQPGSGN